MAKGICSVCAAPPDVLAAVNDAIRKHEKFRDLAARTAFSRAALHRHSQKCVSRDTLSSHKSNRYDPRTDLLLIQWPGQLPALQGIPGGFLGTVRTSPGPNDLVLRVEFECEPRALEPTPDNLGKLFNMAILEDARRNQHAKRKLDGVPAGPSIDIAPSA